MAEINRKEETLLGIARIDEDHGKLVDLLGRLLAIGSHQEGLNEINGILGELDQLTHAHFAREERMLREHRYPGLVLHVDAHREIKNRLDEIKYSLLQKGPSHLLNARLEEFLEYWLLRHVREMDQAYADYFSAQGIRPDPE
ncbi:MAG: hemerythrin family protein [Magnetococcus sp. DMHC-1]|nr:hemerythrin family protein [Magnetococcales bacterium]